MKEGNYFRFQEEFFQQNNGAPMGSPLSPIFAEIFMEHLEEAFNNKIAPTNPRLFKRYVDDIFAIVEVGKEELLLEHLNCLFPNCISFTIEKETRGRLPFLDALVIRSKNRLKTTVYRKPTHSDRYLHFSSHHPRSVFTGIIRGMVDRALSMCDAEFLEGELRYINRTLFSNGYPNNLVSSVIRRMTNTPTVSRQKEYGPVMVLPYYTGIGELFKRLRKTLGFTVYFKTSCSLRTFLRNDKIKVPADKRPGVVYKITCGRNASYVGETGNTLSHRFNQHVDALNRYDRAVIKLNGLQQTRPDSSDSQREEGTSTTRHKGRGRPPKKKQTTKSQRNPAKTLADAIKSSAVVQHSSECTLDLIPTIICRENQFSLRKVRGVLHPPQ
ncbi:hypothetical protein M513_08478 [Trichuris suis]|uniref:Reverse transcriptase domain-containing protein n=1 Tax=Trichuris suis TaxID=68888 RepID=A0A085M0C5_9BILA|nr:hypothetical protein M513_08478 [Trichuris suis]